MDRSRKPPLDDPILARLAYLLDERFRIPGTQRRIGLDGLLGLVPVVGDLSTTAVSLYIVGKAWQGGASKFLLARMAANVLIDSAIGSIPLVGDLFDIGWKANRKNLALLHRHHRKQERKRRHGR